MNTYFLQPTFKFKKKVTASMYMGFNNAFFGNASRSASPADINGPSGLKSSLSELPNVLGPRLENSRGYVILKVVLDHMEGKDPTFTASALICPLLCSIE